jgi:hypothetical protein
VYDLAILVQILPSKRRDCQITIAPVISLEEGKRIAASDDTGTLIVEERGRIALEERNVMRVRRWKTFECQRGRETT